MTELMVYAIAVVLSSIALISLVSIVAIVAINKDKKAGLKVIEALERIIDHITRWMR